MKYTTNKLIFFILIILFPLLVCGQDLPLNNDPSVKTGVLSNGFRYYIKRNNEPAGRATLYLANKVGAILETDEEQGIAHFIEHMNFNGTKHFPKNELVGYLERSGIRFGADLNAYTGFDETVYQLPLPTEDVELWNNGMQIMRDWASDASINAEEFNRERGVIIEEKRLRSNAGSRLAEQYRPLLFNHSRYAERLPIGKEAVILNAEVSIAKNFYKRWYRPDLQALIIVGDIDVKKVEKQIIKLFSDLQPPVQLIPRPRYAIALNGTSDFLKATDPEFAQYYIQYYFKQANYNLKTGKDFRRNLLERLINLLYVNRLSDIYNDHKPAYLGAGAKISSLIGNIDALTLQVALNPEKIKASFDAFWTEMERIKQYGFTDDELQSAKDRLNRSMELAFSEKNKVKSVSYADDYLQYFLKGDAYLSVEDRDRLYKLYINEIKPKDVLEYLQQYLNSTDKTILVLGPDKGKDALPDQKLLNSWTVNIQATKIEAYQSEKTIGTLLKEPLKPGIIIKEQEIGKLGIHHWQLDNGINIYAKPTNFKNNEILISGFSNGGTSLCADSDYYSAKNAAAFITSSGLGQFNARQLEQVLNKKAVQLRPYIADRSEGFSGATASNDLPTAFEMLYLYMTKPRLDTARFDRMIAQSKSAFRNRTPNPDRDLADTIAYVLSGYHPRRKPAAIGDFDQIDSAKVRRIFQERFSNTADFTFVFTGNFDLDSLKSLASKYLGALPPSGTPEQPKDLHIRVPQGRLRKDIHSGKTDKASVQLVISGKYDYGSKANLYLDLLEAALQFRLNTRLREAEGGVYSPHVYVTKAKMPVNFYALTVTFECDPARMEQLINAARQEIDKLSQKGVRQEELQKFIAEETRSSQLALRSNEFWSSYIQSTVSNNEPLLVLLNKPEDLKGLRTEESMKFSRRFLDRQNEIVFTLHP